MGLTEFDLVHHMLSNRMVGIANLHAPRVAVKDPDNDHTADGAIDLDFVLALNIGARFAIAQRRAGAARRFVPEHCKNLEEA